MTMTPLFSVVIPAYNRAHLIEGTLESVFAQSETDYEIVVVDDGSTDGTAEVVRRYEDRLRLIRQDNAGPGQARNTGIEAARGEYVVLLDSDDRWFPWTLATYRAVIERHGRPAFLGGALFLFSEDDELGAVAHEPIQADVYADYLEAAAEGVFVGSCMAAARRDALRSIGGFTTLPINSEDHDLALRLGTEPGFVFVRRPYMVGLRFHEGNISGNMDKLVAGLDYLLQQEATGRYPGGAPRADARRFILAQHARSASLNLLQNGRPDAALSLYRRTLPWQARYRHWRYLLGFPFLLLRATLRRSP